MAYWSRAEEDFGCKEDNRFVNGDRGDKTWHQRVTEKEIRLTLEVVHASNTR